jgi:hypothetical protein
LQVATDGKTVAKVVKGPAGLFTVLWGEAMAGTENDGDRNGTARDEAATGSVALSVVRGLRVALAVPFLVIGALLVAGGTVLMGNIASSRLDRLIDRS